MKKDGTPHPPLTFTPETLPVLDALKSKGWTLREIASELGVGLGVVCRAINREGAYAGFPK